VVASGGSKYAALISRFGALDTTGDAEQQIGTMLRALLQRGIDDGTFRGDLSVTELLFLFGQLLQAAVTPLAVRNIEILISRQDQGPQQPDRRRAVRQHPVVDLQVALARVRRP
jgi:hypothetical protein